MNSVWHLICRKSSLCRIESLIPVEGLNVKPYWKDPDCYEIGFRLSSDIVKIVALCRNISRCDRMQIARQDDGVEYACYATLEEIKNDGKVFVVCFVNMKENEL